MAINKNVGGIDRVLRIIVGIILVMLVLLAFIGPQTPWAYLGFIGLIPLITGIIGSFLVTFSLSFLCLKNNRCINSSHDYYCTNNYQNNPINFIHFRQFFLCLLSNMKNCLILWISNGLHQVNTF